MKVTFWGVRGSFPVALSHCMRYGGNTPCIGIETDTSTILIDAGTGIRQAGNDLVERGIDQIDLLISHTHWDHVQGFPHFAPLYRSGTTIRIHGLNHKDHTLEQIFAAQQQPAFSAMTLDQVEAKLEFIALEEEQKFSIAAAQVQCHRLNHPGMACGYRIEHQGVAFSYISDTDLYGELLLGDDIPASSESEKEEWLERLRQGTRNLAHRTNLMVCDTFFLPEEYDPGWGHSSPDDALRLGQETQAQRIALFHHRPERTDEVLDELFAHYQSQAPDGIEVLIAKEGLEVTL
jgi:phosphoribosyl 1,2-cyclic phosphodiesterase